MVQVESQQDTEYLTGPGKTIAMESSPLYIMIMAKLGQR